MISNVSKFEAIMKKQKQNYTSLSRMIGLKSSTLSAKIKGTSSLGFKEALDLASILHMDNDTTLNCFFNLHQEK